MKKLDNIRSSQNIRQNKKEMKNVKKERSKKRRTPAFRAFVMTLKVIVVFVFVFITALSIWAYSQIDFSFGDDINTFDMKLSSTIYVAGEDGNYYEYEQFKSTENRVWVDIEDVPQNMKDAFVAIEDERFYSHSGVDIKRTLGAVFNVFVKGDSSYGGSTITQQLVKNLTKDNERTNARKAREITRAIVLESKFSKDQILELYMNSIYLSQGVHGIQAASYVYFGKPVEDLSLAECATIAGITQYPSTYDPIVNPENNRKKRLTVLQKMHELGYITKDEYDEAVNEKLVFDGRHDEESETQKVDEVQSYFADHIFEQAKKDIMEEYGYTEQYTENLLYNGGLKIYATMDPDIQKLAENYYEDSSNFPKFSGEDILQSAIIITEPSTGHLKAIVGGRGEKEDARILNRATQSKRQPGSTIKPIAVYAPALEENIINLSTYIDNSPIKIGNWSPSNANGNFSGPVPVQTAVSWSYNMPAIRTLQELTLDSSYDYLKNKLHMTSIVDKETKNGKVYSDKNLSSLALGGLTNGVTPLEMSSAYSCIANGGMYIEPSSYTKICDRNENVLIDKKPKKNRVFSEETAFLMQELLKGVVREGTAAGSVIPGMDTCGKTGTTDDNKDKWFIGFTPYYCSTVWVGFDKPKVISTGTNPALGVWKKIMTDIHKDLDNEKFDVPSGIIKANVCGFTGKYASAGCGASHYANKKFLTGYCRGNHPKTALGSSNYPTKPKEDEEDNQDDENKPDEDVNDTDTSGNDTNGNSNDEKLPPTENNNNPPNPSGGENIIPDIPTTPEVTN